MNPANAQQPESMVSAPGTTATASVTPPPVQPPFQGIIAPTVRESTPHWPDQPRAPKGAPNVVFIMLDDFGFSQLGCYGAQGLRTPNIDKLAANGLRYNNFHATPLCSPTRAAFLTGRNHHSCALGAITEFSTGFPGYNGRMPLSHGMISEILASAGWSTFCLGKWHLTPTEDSNLAASRRWWPLGRGFDRYYGFLGGTTSEFVPFITQDNHFIQPPGKPEDDVPLEWANKYKGVFDQGWDHYREETLKRQIQLGICPPGTKLSPRDPSIPAWDELTPKHQNVFARQMEVFAGFVEFVDDHVGRLIQALEDIGELDNTLIVLASDNGASLEGGDNGVPNEVQFFNNVPITLEMVAAEIEQWGERDTFPALVGGWAWAGNTPFRRWKRETTRGGTAVPLIVHWPKGIQAKGEIRTQFTHAIDVVPTVLDLLDMETPAAINGVVQAPMEGVSFAATLNDSAAKLIRGPQYFEMAATRAIYRDGWRAYSPWPFGKEVTPENLPEAKWMLYHTSEDFSESTDVADQHPEKVAELERLWWMEAAKFNVLPLDGRSILRQLEPRPTLAEPRSTFIYYQGGGEVGGTVAANVFNRSHSITAEVVIPEGGAEGVLLAQGGQFAGYSFYIKNKKLYYTHNYVGLREYVLESSSEVPPGERVLKYEFEVTEPPNFAVGKGAPGIGRLFVDGKKVAEGELATTTPITFALSGEGLCCGWDSLSAASSTYRSPFRFTGRIKKVEVTCLESGAEQRPAPPAD